MTPPLVLRALRPTAWLLVGWAVVLGLRGLGWHARAALEHPDASAREALKGILWDVALVYALFALARFGRALVDASAPAPGWRLPLAVAGWMGLLGSLAAAAVAPALRALDIGHCRLAGCHWTVAGFQHLHPDLAGRLVEPWALALIAVGLATTLTLPLAVWRDGRAWLRDAPAGRSLRWAALPLLVALLPAAWAIRDGVAFPASVYALRLLPETNFMARVAATLADPPIDLPPPALSEALRRRFASVGLVPDGEPLTPGYPLTRRGLEASPVPFPRRQAAAERPNVVVTFVESLSSLFISSLGGRFSGLTPELDRLARQMTVVQGFHNTSSPTISALVTALCGLHPPTPPYDLGIGETVDGATAYVCLADVLRGRGYRTLFVQTSSTRVTAMEWFLRTHGFDEVHGRDSLRRRWPGGPEGVWGAHDDRLVDYVEEQIERLEGLRRGDGRPFLLVMLTVDTHDPGMAADDCRLPAGPDGRPAVADLPPDGGSRRLLASYHCTDRALGVLGRFLLSADRADRVLWLLTTDHAVFGTPVTRPLFTDPRLGGDFAPAPLLIHDPRHDLPRRVEVLSGTQDVAPTLLHLLDIEPERHAMTGHSVFGRRRQLPALVGRLGGRSAYLQSATARRQLPLADLREACQRKSALLADGSDPLSACELAAWLDWQDALWRSRRLSPPHYQPLAGDLDPRWLRSRIELNPAEKAASRSPRAP